MSVVNVYWVYIVRCADESYYVGVTSNIGVRISQHNSNDFPTSYCATRRPVVLVYEEAFSSVDEAIAAEKKIKGWSRAKKAALIRGDWNELRRLAASRTKKPAERARPSTSSG